MMYGRRETNRPKKSERCWQAERREEIAKSQEMASRFPPPDDLSLKRSRVQRIGKPIAWKVIQAYEWLGTLPTCTHYFGLMFDGVCGGVACYSLGSAGSAMGMSRMLGIAQGQLAYLSRGACVHWAPKGSAPRLINYSARELGKRGAHLAIAYSDTDAGEIGTVYQAAGWICIGRGVKSYEWITPSGMTRNRSIVRDVTLKNKVSWSDAIKMLEGAGWRCQPVNRKWRYVKVVGSGKSNASMLSEVEKRVVDYPKRAGQ